VDDIFSLLIPFTYVNEIQTIVILLTSQCSLLEDHAANMSLVNWKNVDVIFLELGQKI